MIPKIIHYCWFGNNPIPEGDRKNIETWKKVCPDYKIIEWNEKNYDITKNKYMYDAYKNRKMGFVPDYARFDIIYEYGGIYLDTDVEILKPLDKLLENHAYMGFEMGKYINGGIGFGAEAHNDIIKQLRDMYDSMNFYCEDGTLNLLPSPSYITELLKKKGLIVNDKMQMVENMRIYPSEYFAPKDYKTGKINVTDNSYTIHHYNGSWIEKNKVKIFINKVINKIKKITYKIKLLLKNKKFFSKIYEKLSRTKFVREMNVNIAKNTNKSDSLENVIIFDTSIASDNLGDNVIMSYCNNIINEIMKNSKKTYLPTHILPNSKDMKHLRKVDLKLVCGTNILSSDIGKSIMKFPNRSYKYNNLLLFGVGCSKYSDKTTEYTKKFYKSMLNDKYIHAVRDEYTKKFLNNIGIYNVVNTSCPTMWNLTEEFCKNIPRIKANNVVTTITDYDKDYNNDKMMIEILKRNYSDVYIWLQGKEDKKYLEELEIDNVKILSSLEEYNNLLKSNVDLDYVGTRLHAGIHALNNKKRSIIIAIDNRATEIARDTNLIIIDRKNIKKCLNDKINSTFDTNIKIPEKEIKKWKEQFK